MITISLCMIVKNEEDVLARCLDSVRGIPEEIILVDTGSTDQTREIAKRYTKKVLDFTWIDDFAAARNFAFSQASMEYCLWLDADDILTPQNREAFLELKQTLSPSVDMVMMPYHVGFDDQGNPSFSYYRERLMRTGMFFWEGPIHEAISPRGEILYSEIAVTHQKLRQSDPDRNLRIFEKLLAQGKSLEPRLQFYYGRELLDHQRYKESAAVLTEFLDSGAGWLENQIEACRQLALCQYRLDRPQEALRALLRSLELDLPRAEICCDLGQHFLDREAYLQAIFWYELALSRPRRDVSGGFVLPDCYGFLPNLQLCVCYHRIGEWQKAQICNERAGSYKPDSSAYLYNQKYFAQLQQEEAPKNTEG